jgi:hypothetical protein
MLTATPLLIWKTRLASLPLTASRPAPGPSMVRSAVMQLAAGQRDGAVPGRAKRIRWGRVGVGVGMAAQRAETLSARLETVKVLGTVRSSSASMLKGWPWPAAGPAGTPFLAARRHEEGTADRSQMTYAW